MSDPTPASASGLLRKSGRLQDMVILASLTTRSRAASPNLSVARDRLLRGGTNGRATR